MNRVEIMGLVSSDYVLVVLRDYSLDTLASMLRFLNQYRGYVRALVSLKTSAITLMVNKVRRAVIIPPLSFFISRKKLDDVVDQLNSLNVTVYDVLEDSWVECKELSYRVFAITDRLPLVLRHAGLEVVKLKDVREIPRDTRECVLISCDECLGLESFNDLMLKSRYVIDLRSISGLNRVNVSGHLKYYLRDHAVVYGVELKEFQGLIADVRGVRRVLTYGRPLVYVNSNYLVIEMPNNSLVFCGGLDVLDELLLRALIYSC
ncbi:MAG: hypothetical protein QXY36_00480 [Sulfolobales archaeon]